MEHDRTGPHCRFDLKYHFVWITKYRKGVLVGEPFRRQDGTEPDDGGDNFQVTKS